MKISFILYFYCNLPHFYHLEDPHFFLCFQIGGVSNRYSEDLQCLVQSLMNRRPDLRPSASQVLHQPFIQNHISVFLKDTTSPSNTTSRTEAHQDLAEDKKTGEDDLKEKQCVIEYDCGKYRNHPQSDRLCENVNEKLNEPVRHKLSARRCCEFLPTEFDSLHIAGDKMKLEERSRMETKPSRMKECKCKQQEKQDLPAAGHIGSQSRRRRRNNIQTLVVDKEEDEENSLHTNPEVFPSEKLGVNNKLSVPHPCSARERRRLKRLQEIEIKSCKEVVLHRQVGNEQESVDGKDCAQSHDSDSSSSPDKHVEETESPCDSDMDSYTCTALSEKFQEEDEFLHLLSTTLSEDSTLNSDEADTSTEDRPIGGDGVGLEGRVSLLEEALINEVGEVRELDLTVVNSSTPSVKGMYRWYNPSVHTSVGPFDHL